MIAFENNKLNFWQLTLTLTVFFSRGGGSKKGRGASWKF